MSVHFSYDFKDELIKKLSEYFSKEIDYFKFDKKQKMQIDASEKIIKDYFNDLITNMKDVIEASGGEILFEEDDEDTIAKITILKNYLKFSRKDNSIEVKIGYYIPEEDIVESVVLSYIVPGDKKSKIRRVGKINDGGTFGESALNYYMREAFSKLDIFM